MSGVDCLLGSLGLTLAGFAYWRYLYFFRDPVREIQPDDRLIVSAADGFVTYVKRVEAGQIPVAIKGRRRIPLDEWTVVHHPNAPCGVLIGVFMTEFSVHRNRSPIAGEVVSREHRKAQPINMSMARMGINVLLGRHPADEDCRFLLTNERLTLGIRHASGAVVTVTQIADIWVNRIVADVQVGDRLARGDCYGMIRFGSQCDVFLPGSLLGEPRVRPGDAVKAGESVLAVIGLPEASTDADSSRAIRGSDPIP